MAKLAKLCICLALFCQFHDLASAQFDPAVLVSVLTTSLGLVKIVTNLWKAFRSDSQDGDAPLVFSEALPDLDIDLNEIQAIAGNLSWIGNATAGALSGVQISSDRAILAHFAAISAKLSGLDTRVSVIESSLASFINQLPSMIQWELGIDRLLATMRPIHALYDTFRQYQEQKDLIEPMTLQDFSSTLVSHGTESVRSLLWQLHDMSVPQGSVHGMQMKKRAPTKMAKERSRNRRFSSFQGIFQNFQQYFQVSSDFLCSLGKSPHQVVYDLYTLLALTDAKGYAMMQFSWMLLRLYGRGNFTIESDIARSEFEQRVIEKAHAARTVLSRLPTWMWKCDPSVANQRENETYLQFTELLHGYIVNEVDLNQDNSCKEGCSSYTNSKETSCFANQFCSKSRRCPNGRIYNCGFIEADSTVCLSNDTPNRRYDWIEYKSGRVLGQKSACDASSRSKTTANSWWRFLWHCSYCVCLCDQPGRLSDRYVSLRASLSDTANNYLVTGLRFVKKNRIVHVQIQEAEALARGQVNTTTLRWKPVEIMFITDKRKDSLDSTEDYATLRYEERALDLDDLNAPVDHVVTGVRFRKLGGNLNLEMQVSPINFTSGEINPRLSAWVGNDNTPASETKPRTKLSLKSPDVPTRSAAPSLPDSKNDQYVEFQASSLEKDVSQTTVPFLDAQPVAPQPPSWLTGVGIFHKGQPGYGGYVALRIATLNVTDYLLLPNAEFNFSPAEA